MYHTGQVTLVHPAHMRRSTSLLRTRPCCGSMTNAYVKTCTSPQSLARNVSSDRWLVGRGLGVGCGFVFTAGHENKMNAPGKIKTLDFQLVAIHQPLFSSAFEWFYAVLVCVLLPFSASGTTEPSSTQQNCSTGAVKPQAKQNARHSLHMAVWKYDYSTLVYLSSVCELALYVFLIQQNKVHLGSAVLMG